MKNRTDAQRVVCLVFRTVGRFILERAELVFPIAQGRLILVPNWKTEDFGQRLTSGDLLFIFAHTANVAIFRKGNAGRL